MEFTADSKQLAGAVRLVKPAVAVRGALALAGIRVAADRQRVTLTGTDGALTIRTTIDAVGGAQPGETVIHHKLLADVAKGKGEVRLTSDQWGVEAVNGTTTRLEAIPLDEWPADRTVDAYSVMLIPAATLAAVASAVSADQTRPALTGVLFDGRNVAASDGYRLHVEPTGNEEGLPAALIPGRAVTAVVKASKGVGEVLVTIGYADRAPVAVLETDRAAYEVPLIEDTYPPFKHLIRGTSRHEAVVDREQLLSSVTAVADTAQRSNVNLRLVFTAEALEVTLEDPDAGAGEDLVPVMWETDPPDALTVGARPDYIIDALATLDAATVTVGVQASDQPLLFGDGTGRVRLVMPVDLR